MTTLTQLREQITFDLSSSTKRIGYGLLVLWLLSMITLPIARWIAGDITIPVGVTLAAILQASAVFYIVQTQWGFRRALRTFGIVAIATWAAEFIGHSTGLPFGAYHYTDVLQPQIGGVPLLIPIAWFMLLPSSWLMAQLIVGEERKSWRAKAAFVAVSAFALTAWDLFLDPQMVGWDFWQWDVDGAYFGIPLSNYAGWLLVSAIITVLANPPKLNGIALVIVYVVVWFLQSFGQAIFWGQIGPAIAGCIGMGSIMVAAYFRQRSRLHS